MPLSIDIFNKKVLSSESRFGTYNLLLSGDVSGGYSPTTPLTPVQLQTSNSTVNIAANLSTTFCGEVTGSKTFTYTNFQTGQYINIYLKANHTGNGVEHTFPSGTLFDKFGLENKIYTHSGYITKIELTNNVYGYLGNSSLIKYDYPSTGIPTGEPTGVSVDPYSDYVALLMHFNMTGASPVFNDAVAFWKLDDVTDSTVNSNTLTNNSSVQFVSGKVGNCAQFDTSNNLTVNPLSLTFNPSGEFTISLWINPASFSSYQAFISGPANTVIIHTDAAGTLYCNNAASADVTINNALELDTWQHIVFIKETGHSKVWINGTNIYDSPIGSSSNPTTQISLGSLWPGGFQYNGKLDMVGLWNRALTQTEIDALYNGGNGLEP